MPSLITPELTARAAELVRAYHPAYCCSLHEGRADFPGGHWHGFAARVYYHHAQGFTLLRYVESRACGEQLLVALEDTMHEWAAEGRVGDDELPLTAEGAEDLLALVLHPLTSSASRRRLFRELLPLLSRGRASEWAASFTSQIEEAAKGTLARRSWTPYGNNAQPPAPHPFPHSLNH